MTYVWSYLAGMLTLINPCVLPLLPITIAAAFQASRLGPVALAGGLVMSFTLVGVAVTAFGHLLGIDEALINRSAAVMMVLFGVVLLIPPAQAYLARWVSPLASRANAGIDVVQNSAADAAAKGVAAGTNGSSLSGQFFIGVLLGAVWSPCIGPTLGGAIGLAASGQGLPQATLTMITFGLGVSTVLMALAYGSREVLGSRRRRLMGMMPWAKPVMGVTLLLVGIGIFFHWQRPIESWLLDVMPGWLLDLSVSI